MGQSVVVTGMVLSTMPISEYDKRITILTKERGKVCAFARGARRPNSQLLAATNPFSFGEFELFEGKSSYNVSKANIHNYFRELTMDVEAAYMGFYFLEFAEHFCQENNDEKEMLKLLYQSLRALESPAFSAELVRCIFELKAMAINGEGPNVFHCMHCHKTEELIHFSVKRGGIFCPACVKKIRQMQGGEPVSAKDFVKIHESTRYAMQFILSTPIEKLFSFQLSEEVLNEFQKIMKDYLHTYVRHTFKSLQIIDDLMLK